MLLEKIREIKGGIEQLEAEVLKPEYSTSYSWEAIKEAFEKELPILSADAVENFHKRLSASVSSYEKEVLTKGKKRINHFRYGVRRKLKGRGVPSALSMTGHIIDYLKTCINMTASKAEIFEAIKDLYPAEVQAIPHRSKGSDHPEVSILEYRVDWACTILTLNKKMFGRNQDTTLPKKHVKLINTTKFTDAEVAYLKKNGNSLEGFKAKKKAS